MISFVSSLGLFLFFASSAFAGSNTPSANEPLPPDLATISYSLKEDRRILDLSIDHLDVPVQFPKYGAPTIELQGKFLNKTSTLMWENYKILDPPFTSMKEAKRGILQEFGFSVPLTGVTTSILLVAVDFFGREQYEELVITFPGYGKRFSRRR